MKSPDLRIRDLASHQKPYVTVSALADLLECDARTITRMINSGDLPAITVGRAFRIPIEVARQRFAINADGVEALSRRNPAKGTRIAGARDGDQAQARGRVNYLVRVGILLNPGSLACSDCGHLGDDRKHEYHHHRGYAPEYHEDVIPLCSRCHRAHHVSRGTVADEATSNN